MFNWLFNLFTKREEEPEAVLLPKPIPEPPKPDIYYVYRPLFNLLGESEGTDIQDGYNETLGYGAYTGGDVDLVNMTLGQIDKLQTAMLKHPNNSWNSSAVGRYQVIRTTLRKVKKSLELQDTLLYSKDVQDTICLHLLEGRGLSKYLSGALKEDTFLTNLAKEWASIPTPSGKGYYGNQSSTPVTPREVRSVLAEVKKRLHS